jgi:hypothetical protein
MLGVHRAGVFRGLGKGLRQLLLGAQLGPGLAEIGDGFEFGGRCRAAFGWLSRRARAVPDEGKLDASRVCSPR